MYSTYLYGTAIVSLIIFFWEHFARKYEFKRCAPNGSAYQVKLKPTVIIGFLAKKSKTFWSYIGWFIAKISSFYTYIDLGDLTKTAQELSIAIGKFVITPVYSVRQYWNTADTYKYPIMIILGTVTVIFLIFYSQYFHGETIRLQIKQLFGY